MKDKIDELAERMIAAARNYDEATTVMMRELEAFTIAHGMAFKCLAKLLEEAGLIDRGDLESRLMADVAHVGSRADDEPIAKAFGRLLYLLREEADTRN